MTTPKLKQIPDHLLYRRAKGDPHRARELIAWCEGNGCRPTWQDLEDERNRRATR